MIDVNNIQRLSIVLAQANSSDAFEKFLNQIFVSSKSMQQCN